MTPGTVSRRRRAAARLAAANGAGAVLNAGKFVLLPAMLAAHELDVLAVGLLIAVTLSQSLGEPLATHAVFERGRVRARRLLLGVACGVLGAMAILPHAAAAVLAPGLDVSSDDRIAIRLFALTGLGLVWLWGLAGERQRAADFSGLGVIALVPNAALLAGALTRSPTGIGAAMLAGVVVAGTVLALRAGRGGGAAAAPAAGGRPRLTLLDLVMLALATQLNVILLRVAAGDLPEGSIGALFVAAGVVTLPVIAIAGSAAAVSLPHWHAEAPSRPLRESLRVAALASAAAAAVLGGLALLDTLGGVRELLDPAVRDGLRAALPILILGTPIYAAAWFLRALVIARGHVRALAAAAAAGALAVPAASLVADSIEGISVGYVLSPIPWLIVAIGVAIRTPRAA